MESLFIVLILLSVVVLIVGLTKPQAIKLKSRKDVALVSGGAILFFFICVAVATPNTSTQPTPVVTTSNPSTVVSTSTAVVQTPVIVKNSAVVKTQVVQPTQTEVQTQASAPVQTPVVTPSPSPIVPAEYKSALSQATTYANTMYLSKQGVYDQLVSEYGGKFSAASAQYAIDNVKADWNANALAQAKTYQDTMNLSPAAVRDQLVSEYGGKFTATEADYAIQHLND
jgi:hypothetical protein